MRPNQTKNQHYVSQAEQRLNAMNPQARPENQRIYAFDIVDRETPIPTLGEPRKDKIARSLSYEDIFSFDVIDSRYRNNLEDMFQRYEENILRDSEALIDKLRHGQADIKTEIV